jgi:hypothetical protein
MTVQLRSLLNMGSTTPQPRQRNWVENELPIVGELKDCYQLSKDRWQGTDVDGAIIRVTGGRMPKYLIVSLRKR